MLGGIELRGSLRCRAESAALLGRACSGVCLRRLLRGPRRKSWNLEAELAAEVLRQQLSAAFHARDVDRARKLLDSLKIDLPAASQVDVHPVEPGEFRGNWFLPRRGQGSVVILYLHGGGYAFYPRGFYDNFSAMLALATAARLFALDYSLAPEHCFPAQLDEAMLAYEWIASHCAANESVVVIGDSAGGNLALSLLLSLRDAKLPMPLGAVCLSPATDFTAVEPTAEQLELDWITPLMAMRWADWFCSADERRSPLVSPVLADLRGLPPIYIQAGGAEILLSSIQRFATAARLQRAEVSLEVWDEMTHDFQAFGEAVPQSMDALRRVGEIVAGFAALRAERT